MRLADAPPLDSKCDETICRATGLRLVGYLDYHNYCHPINDHGIKHDCYTSTIRASFRIVHLKGLWGPEHVVEDSAKEYERQLSVRLQFEVTGSIGRIVFSKLILTLVSLLVLVQLAQPLVAILLHLPCMRKFKKILLAAYEDVYAADIIEEHKEVELREGRSTTITATIKNSFMRQRSELRLAQSMSSDSSGLEQISVSAGTTPNPATSPMEQAANTNLD
eukprot:CAMPEP_0175165746 /NCGR_PEP_ID=MMETSP0087-20121206/27273_1 /TAXON_ID=136419 /ORGANISM="Unknown Unknown, Strain D1" /LENGTH=220 /DNA_ID=CAMNT_0016455189 /DNA_START=36 /DNA_END=698 /DNA_ORIENTATION=-